MNFMKTTNLESLSERFQHLGVDVTILWENLQKNPTERILHHQEMLALVEEAKKAKKPHDKI